MIEFPAIWIWYGFQVLGGLLLALALAQVLNSIRHGSRLPLNIVVSAVFVTGLVVIVMTTTSFLSSVDWSSTYSITLPNTTFLRFGN
jgi:hypothetical protein